MSVKTVSYVSQDRPNDFYYDPAFVTSGSKDYYKQARVSRQMTMNFAICPIFPSMFSDMQNYPNKRYVIRRQPPVPPYDRKSIDTTARTSRANIVGSDRYKYFHNSQVLSGQGSIPAVPKLELGLPEVRSKDPKERKSMNVALKRKNIKNVKVQTVYREISAQTSPWEPEYIVMEGNPDVLKLDFLKWGVGLPAQLEEVEYIDRTLTKKRNKEHLDHLGAGETVDLYVFEQTAMAAWVQREKEIEEIQLLRLELLEKMLNEIHITSQERSEKRIRMYAESRYNQKQKDIEKVRQVANREKRRLELNFKGILGKSKSNTFEDNVNYASSIYCPLMRDGINPRDKHEVLSKPRKCYQAEYCDVENYDTLPDYYYGDIDDIKLPGTRLCRRETKWTKPVLKRLYEELRELRVDQKQYPNLRVCFERESTVISTPEVRDSTDLSTGIHQAAAYLQKLLRGRATQNQIFIGRERCRELINELRGNYALLKGEFCGKIQDKEKCLEEQLQATNCSYNMKTLQGSLKKLSGAITGTLLDFLNKDLQRLMCERRVHAMILLVERMREVREVEEAGRRQKEMRRRKEHDEMFKQVVKVHQETVDLYLQDIITEGMQFASTQKAEDYVKTLVEKVDEEQSALEADANQIDREEYIASMVHNFVIPEVEKQIVRNRLKMRQKVQLKFAHNEINEHIERLPKPLPILRTSRSSIMRKQATSIRIHKEQMKEEMRKDQISVEKDMRRLLEELVDKPFKEAALQAIIPCALVKLPKEKESSSSEEEATIGRGLEGEEDSADEEKFETIEPDTIPADDVLSEHSIRVDEEKEEKFEEWIEEEKGEEEPEQH